jgi:hypothetical protein
VKIGLASDSFGNLEALRRAFGTLCAAGAERLFFLGGRYQDVDALLGRDECSVAPPGGRGGPDDELGFLREVENALARSAARAIVRAEADRLAKRIVRVASRGCPEWRSEDASRKVLDLVDGRVCCLVHDKSDLTSDDIANSALLFHGNSGEAAMVAVGPRLFITPGHLRALDPDGRPPTFALVAIEGRTVVFTVYSVAGEIIRSERAELVQQGKISVK